MTLPIRLKEEKETLSLFIGEKKLHVFKGDILTLEADAIVCPVDRSLDFRSGLARIISQAAGAAVRVERPSFPEPYGKVVVLPPGKLKAKYLFLTVLLGETEPPLAQASIRQAIERTVLYAEFLRLKSIAFPVMGTLKNCLPYTAIATDMLGEVVQHLRKRKTRLESIHFSVFNPTAYDIFCDKAKDISLND
jgi:O-acetyl-ADP-ribose deacetylase (regulator of RNase III)